MIERSTAALLKDLRLAEKRMFEVFNDNNSDDQLDVHCAVERPLGTRIARRVCRPVFVGTATSDAGDEMIRHVRKTCPDVNDVACVGVALAAGSQMAQQAQGEIAFMTRRFDEDVERLVRENPEFAKARKEYEAKERAYQEAVSRGD